MKSFLRKSNMCGSAKRWPRKISWLAFAATLLLSPAVHAQMSGTYTVCASGCNYSTITAAVSALKSSGVNGKTTIEVKAGSYNESVSISGITGNSSTNTITIKGGGSSPDDVNVYNTNTYVFEISNEGYITIENMRIEQRTSGQYYTAVQLNSASNCIIRNNNMHSPANGTTYASCMRVMYSTDNLIENNY